MPIRQGRYFGSHIDLEQRNLSVRARTGKQNYHWCRKGRRRLHTGRTMPLGLRRLLGRVEGRLSPWNSPWAIKPRFVVMARTIVRCSWRDRSEAVAPITALGSASVALPNTRSPRARFSAGRMPQWSGQVVDCAIAALTRRRDALYEIGMFNVLFGALSAGNFESFWRASAFRPSSRGLELIGPASPTRFQGSLRQSLGDPLFQ